LIVLIPLLSPDISREFPVDKRILGRRSENVSGARNKFFCAPWLRAGKMTWNADLGSLEMVNQLLNKSRVHSVYGTLEFIEMTHTPGTPGIV
jgi:hypothetical protein